MKREPAGDADPEAADEGAKGARTRRRIKKAALKLFAQYGLEEVSVRDILRAAGQKNAGSINYYFQSRADLIAELMRDVAKMIDDDNAQRLDAIEASGKAVEIRDIIKILLSVPGEGPWDDAPRQDGVARAGAPDGDDDSEDGDEPDQDDYSLRFFNMVLSNHRLQLAEAMRGQDRGTRRCLAHLRRLAPPMPDTLLRQRLMHLITFAAAAISAREAARSDARAQANLWGDPTVNENLADVLTGVLTQPPSADTLARLPDDAAR